MCIKHASIKRQGRVFTPWEANQMNNVGNPGWIDVRLKAVHTASLQYSMLIYTVCMYIRTQHYTILCNILWSTRPLGEVAVQLSSQPPQIIDLWEWITHRNRHTYTNRHTHTCAIYSMLACSQHCDVLLFSANFTFSITIHHLSSAVFPTCCSDCFPVYNVMHFHHFKSSNLFQMKSSRLSEKAPLSL